MKIRLSFVLFFMLCGVILLSCATPSSNAPGIQPEELIGTKWISVMPFLGFSNTVEFIDEENCIYTLISGPRELTYRIKGNSVLIGRDQYILNGNTFFYKGNPHWTKQE